MIVEGVLITRDSDGLPNIAAMGVLLLDTSVAPDGSWNNFRLRPFEGSRTYANLRKNGFGVFHLVDDVDLLARAALGDAGPVPVQPGTKVDCPHLRDCVRAFEFEVRSADWSEPRAELLCEVKTTHRCSDWIGWNRAQLAVLELTISATRVHLLDREFIETQIRNLLPLIEKTAGDRETQAWQFVRKYLDTRWEEAGAGAKP
jgi:hypothetical protein